MKFEILKNDLLVDYLSLIPKDLEQSFNALKEAEISTDTFSFYTSVASVFSSKIEGEEIELDSYIKHKRFGIEYLADYTKKIDDLYNAYSFAKKNIINNNTICKAHQLLSKHIVAKQHQGKLRTNNIYVSTTDGKIEYVAVSPYLLKNEIEKFYNDIQLLLLNDISVSEVFFYASMIHLVFVKIHPWNDGNGRSGRLLEKWFIAQKLGEKAWYLQSEKMYYNNHNLYYSNLRKLGLEYEFLNYNNALPFLLMLPGTLTYNF